jgi:hypothetical protein
LALKTSDIFGASAATSFLNAKPRFDPAQRKDSPLRTDKNFMSQGYWNY